MKLKTFLREIVDERYWSRTYGTSRLLSKEINDALDRGCEIKRIDAYTFDLDGMVLWGANYPSAYGHLYQVSNLLPDLDTVLRLHDCDPFFAKEKENGEDEKIARYFESRGGAKT